MIIKRILLLPGSRFAQQVTSAGARTISACKALHFDNLCAALAKEIEVPVLIDEGSPEIQESDFLIGPQDAVKRLLDEAADHRLLSRRCLLIDIPRNVALAQAETLGVAGIVDNMVYSQWQIDYSNAEVALYGLRKLSEHFDCTLSPSPRENGAKYQRFIAKIGTNLPSFITAYIKAFQSFSAIQQ